MDIFNIHIEFDHLRLCSTINKHIKDKIKGYVCVVDANVLAMAHKDIHYRKIIQKATINTCDGSSIAMMANKIYGTNHRVFNGPEVFEYYIEKPYNHVLIGNTAERVNQIKDVVSKKGHNVNLYHIDLPFSPVECFDYKDIAQRLSDLNPDIIWVSLGAPKQEIFISNIYPFVSQGVCLGIGSAFDFYTGELHNNKKEVFGLRMIWLERIFKEPKKQLKRVVNYLLTMPYIYFEEVKRAKQNKRQLL